MRKLVKNIVYFLKNGFEFIFFLIRLLRIRFYRTPLVMERSGVVAVLANGPSLKEKLNDLVLSSYQEYSDYIVLNYFALDENFFLLKPKYYCLADPMFFQTSHREIDVKRLYSILENKVDWDMILYVPVHLYNKFIKYSEIKNKYLYVIKVNTLPYKGFEGLRYFFYKKGFSAPEVQTVANLAIYVGLNSGFEQLDLYGVDHTFFESLCVNGDNQLCNKQLHFYGSEEAVLKPIIRNDNDAVFKVSDYLYAVMNMFRSHDFLAKYSEYLGVEVINCTENSMIDSYKREK
jgi:hypothetical protein